MFHQLVRSAPYPSKSHLADHSLRMLNNLGFLKIPGGLTKINLNLMRLGIILHDVGVFYTQDVCHGPESARLIRPHLGSFALGRNGEDILCSIIRAHDDPTFVDNSVEARALRVLDDIDAAGALGVYRFLEIYSRRGIEPPQMFEKPVLRLKQRQHNLENSFFTRKDLTLIGQSFKYAVDVFEKMLNGDQDSLLILEKLKEADFDLIHVPDILTGLDPQNNKVAHAFFSRM